MRSLVGLSGVCHIARRAAAVEPKSCAGGGIDAIERNAVRPDRLAQESPSGRQLVACHRRIQSERRRRRERKPGRATRMGAGGA